MKGYIQFPKFELGQSYDLKSCAAQEGVATRVKSKASKQSSYFVGLRKVDEAEFNAAIGAPNAQEVEYFHYNQYANGVPCVWDVTRYKIQPLPNG